MEERRQIRGRVGVAHAMGTWALKENKKEEIGQGGMEEDELRDTCSSGVVVPDGQALLWWLA